MTDIAQLRVTIQAKDPPFTAATSDQAVLAWGQGPSGQYRRTMVNASDIMSALGRNDGAAFLDKLEAAAESSPTVRWSLIFIKGEGLNVGNPETRAGLDDLVAAGAITQAEAEAVKALAPEMNRFEAAGCAGATERDVHVARGDI